MADRNVIASMITGESPARMATRAMAGQDLLSAGRPISSLAQYHPTMRDRIASWLLGGDERPSDYQRRAVSGLIGSTGLGNDGLSMADFTPAGMALGAEETGRAIGNGAYGDAAMSALGMLPAGAMAGGIGLARNMMQKAGKAAFATSGSLEKFASRNAYIYDPPAKPQRAFEVDYPAGEKNYVERGIADEAGNLQLDMEGRPLTGKYVVGRTHVGGGDVALPLEAYDEIAKATVGAPAAAVPQSVLGRDVGRTRYNRYTGQPTGIDLSRDLTREQLPRVYAHELGHVIDQIAGEISLSGKARTQA